MTLINIRHYDGFCVQHVGIELAAVVNYLVDLVNFIFI